MAQSAQAPRKAAPAEKKPRAPRKGRAGKRAGANARRPIREEQPETEQARAAQDPGLTAAKHEPAGPAAGAGAGAGEGMTSDARGTEAEAVGDEAARLDGEADARLAAEREADAEARRQEEARAAEVLATHRATMNAAGLALNRAAAGIAEVSAVLTWDPGRAADADRAAADAERGLAEFRSYLAGAAGLGAERFIRPTDMDVGTAWGAAVDALREMHRLLGAQIAVLEVDLTNLPAAAALERAFLEQAARSTVLSGIFATLAVREGLAR